MINDHMNIFAPYENIAAWHENQLTRALLVVLRYSAYGARDLATSYSVR